MATTAAILGLIISLASISLLSQIESATFSLNNKCAYPVWPATLNNAGSPQLSNTGFALPPGSAPVTIAGPAGWSGRFWARTGCSTDSSGKFTCSSADCGSGQVACNGQGGAPPATLMEINLMGNNGKDTYDLSLVDGFNVPVSVAPQGGSGDCVTSSCGANLNSQCPEELQAKDGGGAVVGCKSACLAFNTDEYCCRNAFEPVAACKPSKYSQIFKSACPQAYSYAHDDNSSTFPCDGAATYLITFCP
nr:thaumatin-like protein [Allium sativum]UPH74554.1 thaumatin-like protein [Allium sativum]